jgi:N6-adenosine-specific RNA methylase IME4
MTNAVPEQSFLPVLPRANSALSATDVEKIEIDLIAALPHIEHIEEAERWRRKAKAIEAYLRSPELQRPMLGAQRHIEARIGQLLGPAEMGRPEKLDHGLIKSPIQKDDAVDFRILARGLEDVRLESHEWRKSRRALVALLRQRLGLLPQTPILPIGKFSCIVADPPWQQDTGPDVFNGSGERGHDELSYGQLSIDQICNLKDQSGRAVQDCFADNAHLYLWTINKYVEASYTVARAWGFKPSVLLTWCKPVRGIGLGDTFRLTTEFFLFCRRGNLPHLRIIPTTWFEWPRRKHSEKPDEFFDLIESVSPGSYLELFARRQRDAWHCWGNEIIQNDSTLHRSVG